MMMMQVRNWTVIGVAAFLVVGCHGKGSEAPKGQVVATVGGQEITASDLQLELGAAPGASGPDVTQQRAALQAIINRKIVAAAAQRDKLDQTPVGAMVLEKAHDLALVELFQQRLAAGVPLPSAEEAREFVADHPAMFARRRILVLDQVTASNVPADLVQAMGQLNSMDQIVALLDSKKIPHSNTVTAADTLTAPPDAAARLIDLQENAVFISKEGPLLKVSRVRAWTDAPLSGDQAIRVATDLLASQRRSKIVQQQLTNIIAAAKPQVKINPAFRSLGDAGGPRGQRP